MPNLHDDKEPFGLQRWAQPGKHRKLVLRAPQFWSCGQCRYRRVSPPSGVPFGLAFGYLGDHVRVPGSQKPNELQDRVPCQPRLDPGFQPFAPRQLRGRLRLRQQLPPGSVLPSAQRCLRCAWLLRSGRQRYGLLRPTAPRRLRRNPVFLRQAPPKVRGRLRRRQLVRPLSGLPPAQRAH